jgi:hypothetical protein
VIGVRGEAKEVFTSWFDEQAAAPWYDAEADGFEAVLAKLRGQALRLALILHCMEAISEGRDELQPIAPQTMEHATRLADYFKAHQRVTWDTLVHARHVKRLSPLQERVARAILELQEEIVRGMLPTARIAERLNRDEDDRFCVSLESVGKTAKPLGLRTAPLQDRSARGFVLTGDDLARLRTLASPTVRTVSTVHYSTKPEGSCQDRTVQLPSEPSMNGETTRQFGHFADTSPYNVTPCQDSLLDTSDTSDACLEQEDNPLEEVVV